MDTQFTVPTQERKTLSSVDGGRRWPGSVRESDSFLGGSSSNRSLSMSLLRPDKFTTVSSSLPLAINGRRGVCGLISPCHSAVRDPPKSSGRSGGNVGYVPGSRNLLYTQLHP